MSPYRFSADPPAMIAFLEVLGLSKLVSTDTFVVLRAAGGGEVAVHSASGSDTGGSPARPSW